MSTDLEWLKRARLRYIVETYFQDLHGGYAYLARRCRNACKDEESRRISLNPVLKVSQYWDRIEHRALLKYFDDDGPRLPRLFVDIVCDILVREYACGHRPGLAVEQAAMALARYVRDGGGSPYLILHGETFRMDELSFEHCESDEVDADQPRRAAEFLRGGSRKDWDIMRDVAIERPVQRKLVKALEEEGAQLVVLTGAAGDGKSTLLRCTAMALREKGWRVFIADAVDREPFPSLPAFQTAGGMRTCLLIDNADMAMGFPDLERELQALRGVHVVLCARSYLWERKRQRFARALPIEIPPVDAEIGRLADQILAWRAADRESDRDSLIAAMRDSVSSEHPHLLAAMMSATRGQNFAAIVEGIIDDFEDGGEEWALQYVACGALVNDLTDGVCGRLPGRLLQTLIRTRDPSDRRPARAFSSEILSIRSTTGFDAEYDLRHPDITRRVMARYFGVDWGAHIGAPNDMAERLCEIVDAEFDVVEAQRRGEALARLHYSEAIARALFKVSVGPGAWTAPIIARDVAEAILKKYGAYQREIHLRISLLAHLAEFEARITTEPDGEDGARRSDRLFAEATSLYPEAETIWQRWARTAIQRGDIGDVANPGPYSARDIYRRAWRGGLRADAFLANFMKLERTDHLGSSDDPEMFSALWIGREAWGEGRRGSHYAIHILALELAAGEGEKARGMAKEAFEAGARDEAFLLAWFRLEVAVAGSDAGRALAGRLWAAQARAAGLAVVWAYLEEAAGCFDEARKILDDLPPEGVTIQVELTRMRIELAAGRPEAALGVAHRMWANKSRAPDLANAWLGAEEVHAGPESALALARRLWEEGPPVPEPQFLLCWMNLELEHGASGDPEEPPPFSARGLARALLPTFLENLADLVAWAGVERRAGNLGAFNSPPPCSARGLLRAAISRYPDQVSNSGPSLARFEFGEGGVVGDRDDPEPWSGRDLARTLVKQAQFSATQALHLAQFELARGDYSEGDRQPYSPNWYFETARQRFDIPHADLAEWVAHAAKHSVVAPKLAPLLPGADFAALNERGSLTSLSLLEDQEDGLAPPVDGASFNADIADPASQS